MNTTIRARSLRQTMPEPQRRLWRLLRDRRFAGYKFRREHPLGRYVLDFYCAEAKVSLELEGIQHGAPKQHAHDAEKEAYLRSRGIITKRFWNWQVTREPELVKNVLWQLLQERVVHPENLSTHTNARSRSWPPRDINEAVPLRPNWLAPRDLGNSHPSPRPSPR